MTEWNDLAEMQEPEAADLPDAADDLWLTPDDLTEGEKAADYLRSLDEGHERLADYVKDHYDDSLWNFSPDLPIPITTRNMALEGDIHDSGVPFSRQTADMGGGVTVSGVFPEFECRFEADLGDEARSMTVNEQFAACRDQFQDRMFDDPKTLEGLTLEDMDQLEHGYFPAGCTGHHSADVGRIAIVSSDVHRRTGHTGGNALWTPSVRKTS